jgi:hypothetical protein
MENFPESAKEWTDMLVSVYQSQYKPAAASSSKAAEL